VLHTWDLLDFKLGPEIDYPEWDLSWFSLAAPGKFWSSTIKYNFCRILTMVCWYWTNCTFGLYPSSGVCEVCSGWVICCHRCLTCFKGLCCVCTQVSGSVVSNWPLCAFWTCVLWFFGIYILFLNFLRHQTMDKVQKYDSFNTEFIVEN
jgi:hypothetical protein